MTPDGLFEFNVMPFGLCNAPATFERFMDTILRGLKWDVCMCYLDDVIIFGKTFHEHNTRLGLVLDRIEQAGLILNSKNVISENAKPLFSVFSSTRTASGLTPRRLLQYAISTARDH